MIFEHLHICAISIFDTYDISHLNHYFVSLHVLMYLLTDTFKFNPLTFSVTAKFQGRDVTLFQNEFENLFRHFKPTFFDTSNCTISTVNLSNLPIFLLECHNKNSMLPCILAAFWSNVTKRTKLIFLNLY